MRFLAVIQMLALFGVVWGVLRIKSDYDALNAESRRLRRERDMYAKRYREANTRIYNFQDSINLYCICR